MPYVREAAIVAALRLIATRPRGTEIVFSFARPTGASDDPKVEAARAWLSRFEPAALAKLLHMVGFSEVTFLNEDHVARYLGQREDELRPLRARQRRQRHRRYAIERRDLTGRVFR